MKSKNKEPLQWFLTFGGHPIDDITVPEDHPDLELLKKKLDLTAITLIDVDKFHLLTDDGYSAVIHSIPLEPSKIVRIFRRVEYSMSTGEARRIPVICLLDIGTSQELYYFGLRKQCIITPEARFHPEWEDNDD